MTDATTLTADDLETLAWLAAIGLVGHDPDTDTYWVLG